MRQSWPVTLTDTCSYCHIWAPLKRIWVETKYSFRVQILHECFYFSSIAKMDPGINDDVNVDLLPHDRGDSFVSLQHPEMQNYFFFFKYSVLIILVHLFVSPKMTCAARPQKTEIHQRATCNSGTFIFHMFHYSGCLDCCIWVVRRLGWQGYYSVSYTHLTLPTNREV